MFALYPTSKICFVLSFFKCSGKSVSFFFPLFFSPRRENYTERIVLISAECTLQNCPLDLNIVTLNSAKQATAPAGTATPSQTSLKYWILNAALSNRPMPSCICTTWMPPPLPFPFCIVSVIHILNKCIYLYLFKTKSNLHLLKLNHVSSACFCMLTLPHFISHNTCKIMIIWCKATSKATFLQTIPLLTAPLKLLWEPLHSMLLTYNRRTTHLIS